MKKYFWSIIGVVLLTFGAIDFLGIQNSEVSASTVVQTDVKPGFEKVSGTLEVMTVNEHLFADQDLTQKTSRVLPFLSEWQVFAVRKVNGKELAYNLGGNQWVSAENVLFHPDDDASMIPAIPMKGVFVVKVPGRPNWSTVIWRKNLTPTNKYLRPKTAWKVFAKRVLDQNQIYYNLGGNQWVFAGYGYLR